jgi:hypothetical protein
VYREAWFNLRDDRFYGAMGGMGRIYYTAMSRYAADHGLPIYPFITFVLAIDAEYVAWSSEKKPADTTEE